MASAMGEGLEYDDDVIICSVTLQEQYEGWVMCTHPGCGSRVILAELEFHSLSHAVTSTSTDSISEPDVQVATAQSDIQVATALQLREEQLFAAQESDFQIALSLQQQENDLNPATHNTYHATGPLPSPTLPNNAANTGKMNGHVSSSSLPFPNPAHSASHKPCSNIHILSDYKSTGATRGRGGYEAQTLSRLEQDVCRGKISSTEYHTRKQDLLESMHTGRDDLSSCSEGIIQSLRYSYQLFTPPWRFYLSLNTPHFSYSLGDRGWGCGYRNIQMIVGSLLKSEKYREAMNLTFHGEIPTVPRLQELLEAAWREGYDRAGGRDLGFKVRDTRAWIGATEAAVVLRSCGVKAEVVDFLRPTGPNNTHSRLVEWVEDFFRGSVDRPPLYLQHSGHSRTIVGCGQYRANRYLVLLDPMLDPEKLRRYVRLREKELVWTLSRISNHFKKQQYQIVFVDGLIAPSQREAYKVISPFKRFDQ